jgi:hypothetical protein
MKLTIILSLITCSLFAEQPKVIYGEDNRRDVFEVYEGDLKEYSESTVALVAKSELKISYDGKYRLRGQTVGERFNLCRSEKYWDQPSLAHCSGSLIAPNIVLTAGHCITSLSDCEQTSFFFNYSYKQKWQKSITVEKQDVVSCKRIISRKLDVATDYALIEVDTVSHVRPLSLAKTSPRVAEEIFVIGHPSGVPKKITDKAYVRRNSDFQNIFIANLDTYGGNSGSPVFTKHTGEVSGVLVGGEIDYLEEWSWKELRYCSVSKKCTDNSCRGEGITKVEVIHGALAALNIYL